MRYVYLLLLAVFFQITSPAAPDRDSTRQKLDGFIQGTRAALGLKTGLAISIVKDGKIFFSKAYGFADISNGVRASVNTPFYIASSTKSFFGMLAKILSDEKVIDLDAPISTYLPDIHLPAPADADFVTLRDLLTHRSGIESLPVLLRTAYTGQHSDEKLFRLFDSCKFTRRGFRYTNTDYVLAGLIIKKVTGKDWRDLVQQKIFAPLGMDNSSAYVSSYSPGTLPVGYATGNGKAVPYNFTKTDETMHAAGGIYSSAEDLAGWILYNLGDGSPLLSSSSLDEVHSAQIDYSQKFFEYSRFAYGLGWIRSFYNGRLLIHHFGSYSGARSHISFMPDENIGAALLVNDDGAAFYTVDLFADYAYNLLTDNPAADSIADAELAFILKDIEESSREKKQEDDSLYTGEINFARFTGTYSSSDFGEVRISRNDDDLYLDFGNLHGSLDPLKANLFSSDLGAFKVKVEFPYPDVQPNPQPGLGVMIIHGPTDIVFTKQ